jgi:hypothetical protein
MGPDLLRLSLAVAAVLFTSGVWERASAATEAEYASLAGLPKLTGMWLPEIYPFVETAPAPGQQPLPPGLKPAAAARVQAYREALMAGEAVERDYCVPKTFSGRLPMNVGGVIEVLFNPGRVTIGTEAGLVRRIYLMDSAPEMLEESRAGISIGRWEGSALIVETAGMLPTAWLLPGLPVGAGARSVERFSLMDDDRLMVETTLTAPDVLDAPVNLINRYRRAPGRVFTEFDTCPGFDRSFDEANRIEQFNATPPPDLPPPPGS